MEIGAVPASFSFFTSAKRSSQVAGGSLMPALEDSMVVSIVIDNVIESVVEGARVGGHGAPQSDHRGRRRTGGRLDSYGVEGDQRPLRRCGRHPGAGAGGDRRAR